MRIESFLSLKIIDPEKDLIKKVQRRKYVRVKAAIDIAMHSPRNIFSPFTYMVSFTYGFR